MYGYDKTSDLRQLPKGKCWPILNYASTLSHVRGLDHDTRAARWIKRQLTCDLRGHYRYPRQLGRKHVARQAEPCTHHRLRRGEYTPLLVNLEDSKDWDYYYFDRRIGFRMDHFSNNLYEMVLKRNPAFRLYQGALIMFPYLDEHRTQDMFNMHPTKPDH
jgi:hypothetical protein